MRIIYIAVAGMAGTLARYGLEQYAPGRAATLTVNLAGSFALGFIIHYATRSGGVVSPDLRGALTIGFCGAFTTMSTFSYETLALLSQGSYWRAGLYGGATIFGCLTATLLGMVLAERLV